MITSGLHEFDMVIASPNAAIDSYYVLTQLHVGKVNRSETVFHTAGGKGNNMARAAAQLGARVLSLGIVGGTSGHLIAQDLKQEGITFDAVWTPHETRRCVTIPGLDRQQTTVILESGGPVGQQTVHEFAAKIQAAAERAPFLTLNGSLPPDFPDSFYADAIRSLRGNTARICLDTAGNPLKLAAQVGPSIIKVNLEEFQSAFPEHHDWKSVLMTFARLRQAGGEFLIITDGPRGAYVFSAQRKPFRVWAVVESCVSTAGAGDTFLAGLLYALGRSEPIDHAARFATAAAAANLQQVVCGAVDKRELEAYLAVTEIEELRL